MAFANKSDARGKLLIVNGLIGRRPCRILIDSGASTDFVSEEWLKEHRFNTATKLSMDSITLADGRKIPSGGLLPKARLQMGRYRTARTFHAAKLDGFDAVLGKGWLADAQESNDLHIDWKLNTLTMKANGRRFTLFRALGKTAVVDKRAAHLLLNTAGLRKAARDKDEMYLVRFQDGEGGRDPKDHKETDERTPLFDVTPIMNDYKDVVCDDLPPGLPPQRQIDHRIDLEPNQAPPYRPPYRTPEAYREELRKQINELLDKGFIRPSASPFGAPVLFVKKKDGSLRMCVDYRMLNKISIKNRYPMPRVDDLLDRLRGAKFLSKVDAHSGFNQIRIAPEHIERTAFTTAYGLFEYTVLPFGLCNAPATFQRLMNEVLREEIDDGLVCVYMDDVLIYSETEEDHKTHLRRVLGKLRQHRLYLKKKKCEFAVEETEFLGHLVGRNGIRPDPKKTQAVANWPVPKTATELRSFL